jgi:mannose-6-phosphate isomerase-like protein (cupin superfamily)
MLNLYSRIDPTKLILTLIRKKDVTHSRHNITPDEQFLQAGAKKLKMNEYFPPHYHLPCEKTATRTEEAWVILNGRVEGKFYDLDYKLLETLILDDGDCIVLYRGGHSLRNLDENTIMYEFKTGPYYGTEKDKAFIKEE